MEKLRQLGKDVLKNWDVYIVIISSIIVGSTSFYLSFFGKTNTTTVLSLTLSLLALVAISIRRDRQADTEVMQSLLEISSTMNSITKNKAFEQQRDAYSFLVNIINQYGAKEAVLLQYSCTTSLEVVRTLLKKGAKVTVYIQHEDTPKSLGSQLQADRILQTCRGLRGDLGNLFRRDRLRAYKYRTPSSISGIKIDNRVLCMGWYTYERVVAASYQHYPIDTVEVSAHDVAAMVVWKGTDEFEALDKTFSVLEKNYRENSEEVAL